MWVDLKQKVHEVEQKLAEKVNDYERLNSVNSDLQQKLKSEESEKLKQQIYDELWEWSMWQGTLMVYDMVYQWCLHRSSISLKYCSHVR